ncbi:ribonucleotide reductase N-terminal alpha domain-containing protein [Metabacillus fastidiosus]|uniref:ribonucleotide reductase N-terminal alpha domain-containing protein n=1 Tax=Metabacillus fastidiosus TaxID=1458 RepID=UPI003D28F79B
MKSPELSKVIKEDTYFKLNNLLNIPIDGKIQLEKDKEAAKAYFLEYVNPNTVFFHTLDEKLDYLIENDYIKEDFLNKYSRKFIKELFKKIYKQKFRFRSFMGAYKFYQQYAMKTDDGKRFLERYEDRLAFNALALANGDEQLALDLAEELINQRYQPATPTFLNIGKKRAGEMVSCFLLTVSDDMNGIGRSINSALQLSKLGGGVGINVSNIRANNDPIKGVYGLADGVVPVMKMFEDAFSYANQGGARDGAGVVYLNVFHPDVVDFLSVRKENADEKVRIKTLSLGLVVPDKFYELIKNNEDMYLFSPHDVQKEYGKPFSYINITEEYDNLVNNSNIRKSKIKARELETEISNLQNESGYPYIINIDTANRENAVDGDIIMSNLCVTGDTKLLTKDGYKSAKELYETGEELKVIIDNRTKELSTQDKGISTVNAIPMQLTAKQADVFKITTKEGFEIKSTEWHKYYVKRDGTIIKLPLSDLKIGDKLLVQSSEGAFGTFHDPELAYLMGVITGDGTYSKKDIVRLYLYDNKMNLKDSIEEKVKNVIERYLDRSFKHNAALEPKFRQATEGLLEMNSGLLGYILDKFKFNKETKLDFPEVLFNADKETVCAYLSGLFQMDATVNANMNAKALTIELTSVHKDLLKDIQMTLLNLGVYSTIYTRTRKDVGLLPDGKGGQKYYPVKTTYKLSVQDRISREKFVKDIQLKDYDMYKFNMLTETLQPKSRKPKHDFTATIDSIDFYSVEDVYDTTQEDYHSLIFNGIVTGNCTEIFQVQKESAINNDQTYEILGNDISCNLGSTNVVNLMDSPDFGKSVRTMLRALTYVTDTSNIDVVPSVKKGNEMYHSVGLGAMNLHGFLAKNKIYYGSPEALEFTDIYFMLLNYWTLVESNNISIETGEKFYEFEKSKYADGTYFDKYLNELGFDFKHDEVRELFKDIFIPKHEDWKKLKESVMEHGIYNAFRLATAPTGSISYVNEATASIHPITQRIEERTEGKRGKVYYPAPYLSDETIKYYESAYDIDQRKIIDTYAKAQRHVDQGLSMTLFTRSEFLDGMYEWKINSEYPRKKTTRDLNIFRNHAWKEGIKSIYYIRTFTDDGSEVGANYCESCSI